MDWKSVGRELQRSACACTAKWCDSQAILRAKSLKKGPFFPEEDAVIIERVSLWDMSKHGLWSGLGRELGRKSTGIQMRWKQTLSKRLADYSSQAQS
jgi:hypothetical protein